MKKLASLISILLSLVFGVSKAFAQLHEEPTCGNNFTLQWSTFPEAPNEYGWAPGNLSNTFSNVDDSEVDITIAFSGETSTLGFWSGNTPKIGSQSSYLYKGLEILTNGFTENGITCTITFSKPIYALSFDIHHVNVHGVSGDKYIISGKNSKGETIYPEFTNSISPTYTSNDNTGIVNAVSNLTAGENPMVGVNFSDTDLIESITILWKDCDSCVLGNPHATGIGNLNFCTPQNLGFDGIDDYISVAPFLGDNSAITMMAWIKLDNDSNGGEIMGQRNCRIYVDENKKLKGFVKTNSDEEVTITDKNATSIEENIWHHIAMMYDGNHGNIQLYLNGELISEYKDDVLTNSSINNTIEWEKDYDFEIGRNAFNKDNYFEGSINETRVYAKALNKTQLYRQINQKIHNNAGKIRGDIISKDIEGLLWEDLLLYYNMAVLNTGFTPDLSSNKFDGKLHGMTDNQEYTAPLPYITSSNGQQWNDSDSWLHGDVWNIHKTVPEHAIVKVENNIEVSNSINLSGLIIDEGKTLNVKNNSGLFNSWHLQLNGIISLEGNSQLIQEEGSELEQSNFGRLEKEVEGTADKFAFDYWSSPVNRLNTSGETGNFTVNDIFSNVEFLKDGYDGSPFPLGIADYWIWKFNNKLSDNFASWQHIRSYGELQPGEGFTMKGPGTGTITDSQNYIIHGIPNNGDIQLPVNKGSDYLIGNPYPSYIDAVQFIMDNQDNASKSGTTNGTLYFWNNWEGNSHNDKESQGSYAVYSLAGGLPAASKMDNSAHKSILPTSNNIPGRYIPVGRGFYITSEKDGFINFNNGQRVFKVEEESQPIIAYKGKSSNEIDEEDSRMKLRIGLNSVNGINRQLLLTQDKNASLAVDWGYDSRYFDSQIDDIYWLLNNEKYVIQAIDTITSETVIPIGIHTNSDGENNISIQEIENPNSDLNIYLHDKSLNTYHDLKKSSYTVFLAAGTFLNRYEITFSKAQTLSNEVFKKESSINLFYSSKKQSIIIKNPSSQNIKSLEMFNILAQSLFKLQINNTNNHLEYRIPQHISGNFIINIQTDLGKVSKKIVIN